MGSASWPLDMPKPLAIRSTEMLPSASKNLSTRRAPLDFAVNAAAGPGASLLMAFGRPVFVPLLEAPRLPSCGFLFAIVATLFATFIWHISWERPYCRALTSLPHHPG